VAPSLLAKSRKNAARIEPDCDLNDRIPVRAALDEGVKLAKLFEMVIDFDRPAVAAIAHYRHPAEMLVRVVHQNEPSRPLVLDSRTLP
jgi:hypothetical protein